MLACPDLELLRKREKVAGALGIVNLLPRLSGHSPWPQLFCCLLHGKDGRWGRGGLTDLMLQSWASEEERLCFHLHRKLTYRLQNREFHLLRRSQNVVQGQTGMKSIVICRKAIQTSIRVFFYMSLFIEREKYI